MDEFNGLGLEDLNHIIIQTTELRLFSSFFDPSEHRLEVRTQKLYHLATQKDSTMYKLIYIELGESLVKIAYSRLRLTLSLRLSLVTDSPHSTHYNINLDTLPY